MPRSTLSHKHQRRLLSCAAGAGRFVSLSDGRSVLQPALVPEFVEASVDGQTRARADVALERLAVVADRFHDLHGPIVVEAETLAEIPFLAGEALDLGIGRARHLVDVGLGDAELLRVEER